jgi:hypothetical protein
MLLEIIVIYLILSIRHHIFLVEIRANTRSYMLKNSSVYFKSLVDKSFKHKVSRDCFLVLKWFNALKIEFRQNNM